MRISQAALALITRINLHGETEYLTQWNNAWQAYSLIGGHVEADETFRECCVREVEEELELQLAVEFRVEDDSLGPMLEYEAISKAAGVLTRYRVELFATWLLNNEAALKVIHNPDNFWLTESEIFNMTSRSSSPIADQVGRLLRHYHQLQGHGQ